MRHIALAGIVMVLAAGAACEHKTTPVQPTPLPCTFVLSASSLTFDATGGSASVTVTAGAGCAWTAASDRAWMSIVSGATGSGNGAVEVSVAANASASERTGTLTVAGQALGVSVAALALEPCSIAISPVSADFGHDAASGRFAVTAPDRCEWSAQSRVTWLTITSGDRGSGAGSVATPSIATARLTCAPRQ